MKTVYLILAMVGTVSMVPGLYVGSLLWEASGNAIAFFAPMLACLALAGFCLHKAES